MVHYFVSFGGSIIEFRSIRMDQPGALGRRDDVADTGRWGVSFTEPPNCWSRYLPTGILRSRSSVRFGIVLMTLAVLGFADRWGHMASRAAREA
jgi:hypothetical protein